MYTGICANVSSTQVSELSAYMHGRAGSRLREHVNEGWASGGKTKTKKTEDDPPKEEQPPARAKGKGSGEAKGKGEGRGKGKGEGRGRGKRRKKADLKERPGRGTGPWRSTGPRAARGPRSFWGGAPLSPVGGLAFGACINCFASVHPAVRFRGGPPRLSPLRNRG